MPRCQITLSANAGIALQLGSVRLWSDALHTEKVPGFSTVSPALWEQIRVHDAFVEPNLIFYTHCHPDHYSRELTAQAKALWPFAELILPEREFDDQILISGQRDQLSLRGLSLRFGRLTHEGEQYREVPNYGCIINDSGFRILIVGDCAVGNPELADFIGDTHIDLALLDFPWVTLRKGRVFIEQYICPERLIVYHLPFAEDNEWGYREAAARGAGQLHGISDIRILQDAFQSEEI
jgi:L-ascorbate metabolism protein UlaG (beta-lactamase superfamily)